MLHIAEEAERAVAPKRDPLTLPHRDETRTAYILQAVESAWEGVDRRKATGAKDPPVAEDLNGVVATAEQVSGPSSHLENSEGMEVCVSGVALSPCVSPSSLRLRGWGSKKLPFLVSALREKGSFWDGQLNRLVSYVLPLESPELRARCAACRERASLVKPSKPPFPLCQMKHNPLSSGQITLELLWLQLGAISGLTTWPPWKPLQGTAGLH